MSVKYPRTYHLPYSEGATSDDKTLRDDSIFTGKKVVVTEKMDGENTTLMKTSLYARSVDSKNHISREWIKNYHSKMCYNIPDKFRICGENLYAKHSIYYDSLESYFLSFSIWDENNTCLAWDNFIEWCNLLDVAPVPVIYRGLYDVSKIFESYNKIQREKEGFVVRLEEGFNFKDFSKSIAKYVRKNHVQTEKHWIFSKIVKNEMVIKN